MEELRPVLADRLALSLINRGQVAAEDFIIEEAGAVRLTDRARKAVLIAWQERKRDELTHPFLDERIPWGWSPTCRPSCLRARCAAISTVIHRSCGGELC